MEKNIDLSDKDSENGFDFHGSVNKISSKDGFYPIKSVVRHIILRTNDLPRVKRLELTLYVSILD